MQLLPVPPTRLALAPPRPMARAVEARVFLHCPVTAMPHCGVYLTLRSVDDALAFLHRYLTEERSSQLDCIRAERLLQLAAASPTRGVRQSATVALRDLLRAESMLG